MKLKQRPRFDKVKEAFNMKKNLFCSRKRQVKCSVVQKLTDKLATFKTYVVLQEDVWNEMTGQSDKLTSLEDDERKHLRRVGEALDEQLGLHDQDCDEGQNCKQKYNRL